MPGANVNAAAACFGTKIPKRARERGRLLMQAALRIAQYFGHQAPRQKPGVGYQAVAEPVHQHR